jgi:hypothetical protein
VSAITLPGDIPGLLRRGCPVVVADVGATLVWTDDESAEVYVLDTDDDDHTFGQVESMPVQMVALDLSDEAGADRAARWLGEHKGVTAGKCCPQFENRGEGAWTLIGDRGLMNNRVIFAAPERRTLVAEPVVRVPALASIDLAHPQADLLALRAVCLHVANRQEQP